MELIVCRTDRHWINGFKLDERVGKEAQLFLRTYERRNLIWAGASGQDLWRKNVYTVHSKVMLVSNVLTIFNYLHLRI